MSGAEPEQLTPLFVLSSDESGSQVSPTSPRNLQCHLHKPHFNPIREGSDGLPPAYPPPIFRLAGKPTSLLAKPPAGAEAETGNGAKAGVRGPQAAQFAPAAPAAPAFSEVLFLLD